MNIKILTVNISPLLFNLTLSYQWNRLKLIWQAIFDKKYLFLLALSMIITLGEETDSILAQFEKTD